MRTAGLPFLLLLSLSLAVPSTGWGKSPKKSSPADALQSGWCCDECEVTPGTRGACEKKGGLFSSTQSAAEKACASQKKWCCVKGSLISATRAECDKKKGAFFCDKEEGKEKCAPPPVKPPAKKTKAIPPVPSLPGKKAPAPAKAAPVLVKKTPAAIVPTVAVPLRGWCLAGGGLLQLSKVRCVEKKGRFFSEKKEAVAYSLSKKGPEKIMVPKPGAAQMMKVQPGVKKAAQSPGEGMKPAPGLFGARVPPKGSPAKTSAAAAPGPARMSAPAAAPVVRSGGQASTRAQRIMFLSPGGGDAFNWGDTVTVRYQVTLLNEEPGNVTFTLRDPDYRTIATTTHYYDMPVIESLDEIDSIEPVSGGLRNFSMGGDDESDGESGPGASFDWTLPAAGARYGHGFTIAAEKGPHRGVSERFTMISDCSHPSDLMSVSIEPPQAVLRRGEAVTVAFSFCGWGGLTTDDPPVYLRHGSSPQSERESWVRPRYSMLELSEDRVRGAMRVTVPRDAARDEGHVFTLVYGGGMLDTQPFEIQGAIERGDIELTDLFHESTGDIVARVWVGGSLGGTALTVRVNDRVVTHTVEEGENDIVVGSLPYNTVLAGLSSERECSEEWEVELDPGNAVAETNEGNNLLTKRFSHYESAGVAWLVGGVEGSSGTVKRIDCGCRDGTPLGECSTHVILKNCSEEPVDLGRVVTVTHHGTRQRSGALGTEEFSETVPHELTTGYSHSSRQILALEEIANITVRYENYAAYSDSHLRIDFGYPVSRWAVLRNPFEIFLNFGSMVHFDDRGSRCEF